MRRFFELVNALQPLHGLILLIVAAIGISGTFTIGRQIEESSIESWLRQAELDVSVATTTAQGWLAQSETIVSGLALGFQDPEALTTERFEDLIFQAEDWNSEFSLDAVAIVKRIMRPERAEMERAMGQPLGHATDSDQAVPDAFEHMVVQMSTDSDGPLRPSADLLTMPEMGTVATTAQQVPDKAILGPAFAGSDGRLFSLVGISLPDEARNAVLVGRVDLSELIGILLSDYVPAGLALRMSERDNEDRADTLLRPIYGPIEAAADTVHTVTIRVTRGQARWNYHWDITPDYLGGAPTARATMVQIGGLIITILVVYTIGLLSLQNTLIKTKVEEQTKELTEAKAMLLRSHDHLEDLVAQRTAALRESEARLAEAHRIARVGHWEWDEVSNRQSYASDETNRIWGAAPGTLLASFDEFLARIHPDDRERVNAEMARARSDRSSYESEYRVVQPGGDVRYVVDRGEIGLGDNGEVVRSFGTVQDITEMKRAEEQLRQAQKMEAVGQLTGGVAHDFNNLLAIIQGNAELVAEQVSGSSIAGLTKPILRATERGSELTHRLLAFSRQQPLHPRPVDIAALAADMCELLARTLGETVEIEISTGPDTWYAFADPGQVENAILNLSINARDAMPDGGRLVIQCENSRLGDGVMSTDPEVMAGDYVLLAVRDTGKGMSADVLAQSFNPFFTTKEVGQGSGLGLSMVYGFARQSGGHVTIESEPGRGTTVKLYLPRAAGGPETADAEIAEEALRGHGERILVIEDNADVRSLTLNLLGNLGYDVVDVADAEAARAILQNGRRIDLILSDIVLPGGTSGPQFAQELWSRDPSAKFIFMSGHPGETVVGDMALGADTILLNKPFKMRQLAKSLREALGA